jgi:2-keto-4-pentenoate hydratase/2-oxohepta-3-ene-1,7-dioic acid hydratase in catechol pathway
VRLVNYFSDGASLTPGLVAGDLVIDAADAIERAGVDVEPDSIALISLTASDWGKLDVAAKELASTGKPLASLRLGPPVANPDKIICLGLNYRDHAAEAGAPIPEHQILFMKNTRSLIGSGETIVPPVNGTEKVDYEAELGLVIGREGRNVSEADALQYVAGYMNFNDVSARDLQLQTPQWVAGKAIDTFGPCGPYLVTADEVEDPQALRVVCRRNGEVLQDGNTKDMIFNIRQQIAFISALMTILPGDIIATGTPAGVGIARKPPILLREGDTVEVEIGDLGVLTNPVGAPK